MILRAVNENNEEQRTRQQNFVMKSTNNEGIPEKEVDLIDYGVAQSIDKNMFDLERIEER